eukprot:COSAG05_NODE_19452_length_292_cov_1.072539_1_plen_66_part_10
MVSLGSQLLLMAVRHRHVRLATGLFDVGHEWLDLTQNRLFGSVGTKDHGNLTVQRLLKSTGAWPYH